VSEFANFIYTGLSELEELEKNLQNYNNFIVKKFKFHSNDAQIILDFGAGIGTLSSIWRFLDNDASIKCLEIDNLQVEILRKRGFSTISNLDLKNTFEYIFTSNVLEHIEDDELALAELYSVLKINGKLGIFVPANKILYSHIDKKIQHFRRYSKKDLINKVQNCGFKIDSCIFVDSLGFFAWGFAKLFILNIDSNNMNKLKFYDKYLWPISKTLDKLGFKYFLGKNLLLLASKK